jgi:hypothetical protein
MTSSITFNVGALTFGVREQSSRFYGVSHAKAFPIWNATSIDHSMKLKTKSFHKPSSNTLNVGAPTFFAEFVHMDPFPTLAGLKPSGYKSPLFVGAGLQPGKPSFPAAVSQ